MNITMIGTGFVGVVSAAVFASFGNSVIGLDIDPQKIEKLKQGIVPFFEPGLTELLLEQQKTGNLSFTTQYEEAISNADIIIIAVGTPSKADGQADLKYVFASVDALAPFIKEGAIIAVKSTVPPGTLLEVEDHLRKGTQKTFYTASLPEFLKEGTAVDDTLHPDRIVLGAREENVFEKLAELHKPLNAPLIKVSPESAQMAKYSANSYLALRIAFINQIADLCEKNGANVQDVIRAIGPDKRIGPQYWYPGFGYGGSCFPKDVRELSAYSRSVGEEKNLLNKINELNDARIPRLMDAFGKKIGGWKGKSVAILGLSFKPNTDDTREAPAVYVIPYLVSHGAHVKGYDPKAQFVNEDFTQVSTLDDAVIGADVVCALIEWPEIIHYDFSHARTANKEQWFIDARNQFSSSELREIGFSYLGVGHV